MTSIEQKRLEKQAGRTEKESLLDRLEEIDRKWEGNTERKQEDVDEIAVIRKRLMESGYFRGDGEITATLWKRGKERKDTMRQ